MTTAGNTPDAPPVGAATMRPIVAFTSPVARAAASVSVNTPADDPGPGGGEHRGISAGEAGPRARLTLESTADGRAHHLQSLAHALAEDLRRAGRSLPTRAR